MKNAMVCSFFGHRELSDAEALYPILKHEIENAVAEATSTVKQVFIPLRDPNGNAVSRCGSVTLTF